jgi:hypothetical protein
MTTTVERNEDGSATITSDKLNAKSTRFPMVQETVNALLCDDGREKDVKGAKLSVTFAGPLKLKDAKVEEVKPFKVKDGGTQSQNFQIKLQDGSGYFMKLSGKGQGGPKAEQQKADSLVGARMPGDGSPFVLATAYVGIKVGADKKKLDPIDVIVFKNIDASQIIGEKDGKKRASKLGQVLGEVYRGQLDKERRLADFYKGGGVLSKVLIHEDFQMSNILLAKGSDRVFLVDLGGIEISKDEIGAYKNLREAVEMTSGKDEVKILFQSFLEEFDAKSRPDILAALVANLKKKGNPDVSGRGAEFDTAAGELKK